MESRPNLGDHGLTLFSLRVFIFSKSNLEYLLKGWGDQIQITTYLDKDVGTSQVEGSWSAFGAMPEVDQARHITREQAWNDFRIALGAQSAVLEGLPRDVLPASFEITVKPAYRDRAKIGSSPRV